MLRCFPTFTAPSATHHDLFLSRVTNMFCHFVRAVFVLIDRIPLNPGLKHKSTHLAQDLRLMAIRTIVPHFGREANLRDEGGYAGHED